MTSRELIWPGGRSTPRRQVQPRFRALIARLRVRGPSAQDTIAVVKLTGEYDGITAEQVREIVRMQEITEVPNAPAHVEGVINLRGRIVPVVDLRKHFGLPGHEHTAETRIVIAEIETE